MIAFLQECLFVFLGFLRRFRLWMPGGDPVVRARMPAGACNAPKPDWVRREIVRMKRLMPDAGCRSLELLSNRF